MSTFFLILQIICIALLLLLCFILFFAVLILFYPINFNASAEKNEKLQAELSLSWLFRSVHFSFTVNNKKSIAKLYIFGIPINFKKKAKNKNTKEKKKAKHTKNINKSKKQNRSSASSKNNFFGRWKNRIKKIYNIKNKRTLIKQTLNMIKSVLKSLKIKKFNIYINFGFDNPYNTGAAVAFLSVLNPFLPKKINYDADFEKSTFKTNSFICGSLTAWNIGFPIIMYILKLNNTEDKK